MELKVCIIEGAALISIVKFLGNTTSKPKRKLDKIQTQIKKVQIEEIFDKNKELRKYKYLKEEEAEKKEGVVTGKFLQINVDKMLNVCFITIVLH